MASTIAAITTGVGGVVTTADATGNLSLLSGTTTIVDVTSTGAAVTGTLSASGVSTFAAGTALLPALTTTGDTNTGVWFPAADTIAASTAGSERMRIDSSGNVGIGTSSPSYKLHSSGTIGTGVAGTNGSVAWKRSSDGAEIATIATDGTTFNYNSGIQHVFQTAGTERMRIDSSGNLLVGTTSQLTPGGVVGIGNIVNTSTSSGQWALALQNNGTSAASGRILGLRNATDFNTTQNEVWYYIGNNTARGYFTSNGGLYNYQANNVNLSDRSTKKDITPAKNYLDIICSIPVVTFLYNDQTDNDLNLGVIAQDVEAVAPELITITKLGVDQDTNEEKVLKGIYQTDLQYALMKCIQEQQTIINDLKARITALEAR